MAQLTYYVAPWDQDRELPAADDAVDRSASLGSSGDKRWRTVTSNGPAEVSHGYTLDDLYRLTRATIKRDRVYAMDITDRMETIWFAMVELLLTSEGRPEPYDLIGAGMRAVGQMLRDDQATHGQRTYDTWAGREAMVSYQRYWWTAAAPTPSPERRVVERLTVSQILPQLSPRQREALTTLAALGDYQLAAQAMGVAFATFTVTISAARRRFLELWHEGETPSKQWRTDRRVRSRDGRDHLGRQRLTVSQVDRIRARYQDGETLKTLATEHGVSPTCLSRLLRGLSKPAPDPAEAA